MAAIRGGWRAVTGRGGWRAVTGIGSLGCVRRRGSTPWYQELVETEKKTTDKSVSKPRAFRSNILKTPGVLAVDKMSKESLCEHLAQSVVYQKGPLVAINKPQGLSITGRPEEPSVVSVLPELQQILQTEPDLHVVKAAPKESSGLVLLSTCHVTTKTFEDYYAACRKEERPITTFCAVTLGIPSPGEGEVKVALRTESGRELDPVVPVLHPSKGSLERREVKRTHTKYKVLHSEGGCALLQLQPMSVYRDQLLVHTTLKFCPILGDHNYSARVAKVLGENIYVPLDIAKPRPQHIQEKILLKMLFKEEQVHQMPLHLHLQYLLMPDDFLGVHPIYIGAPPPPFFTRTMKLLNLKMKQPVLDTSLRRSATRN
ncbi:mitochondrial mRNA pseudouridine synthase RPUSD3 [Leptodactylus fuscus]|uniref:mitochondrial mRNA pseudouridine synthase RPUSD3 n=1 Tax=Leptodactylus fuscus TaxID=238119 RepID=UPI003F4E7CA2